MTIIKATDKAADILSMDPDWHKWDWPTIPQDVVFMAECYAKNGETPKLRRPTAADRREAQRKQADAKKEWTGR